MRKKEKRAYRSPFQDIVKMLAVTLWVRIVIIAVTAPIPAMTIFWTVVGILQMLTYFAIDDWFMKIGFYGPEYPIA
jgi:hypothetical protein